jgi:hypothetical protein
MNTIVILWCISHIPTDNNTIANNGSSGNKRRGDRCRANDVGGSDTTGGAKISEDTASSEIVETQFTFVGYGREVGHTCVIVVFGGYYLGIP